MTAISVQVSVYGLGAADTGDAVATFLNALDDHELTYEVGAMSTVVWGEESAVWQALREGYAAVAALGPVVMQVTVSNACPLPETPGGHS